MNGNDPSKTATPKWVKVFGIGIGVVILVFAIMHATGLHGGHGMPDRLTHMGRP